MTTTQPSTTPRPQRGPSPAAVAEVHHVLTTSAAARPFTRGHTPMAGRERRPYTSAQRRALAAAWRENTPAEVAALAQGSQTSILTALLLAERLTSDTARSTATQAVQRAIDAAERLAERFERAAAARPAAIEDAHRARTAASGGLGDLDHAQADLDRLLARPADEAATWLRIATQLRARAADLRHWLAWLASDMPADDWPDREDPTTEPDPFYVGRTEPPPRTCTPDTPARGPRAPRAPAHPGDLAAA